MLDFPNSPSEGDTHVDGNQAWVYMNGGWVSAASIVGLVTEVVEADVASGWQVWGDTLIQWGSGSYTCNNDGDRTSAIPFAQAFKTAPAMVMTNTSTTTAGQDPRTVSATNVTATDWRFQHKKADGTAISPVGIIWIAIGEAPDNLKKPKEVLGGAAEDMTTQLLRVKPTSSYSWSNGNNVQGLIVLDEEVARVGKSFATLAGNKVTFTVDGWYRIKGAVRWVGPTDGLRTLGLLDLSKNSAGTTATQAIGYNRNNSGATFDVDEASTQAEAIVSVSAGDTVEMYLTFRKESGTGPTVSHTIAQDGTWFEIERLGDL